MDTSIFDDVHNFVTATLDEGKKPLVVILGPTASGKTSLSLEIAQRIGGEVISADSRQVYTHMDIGTDKIMPNEQQGVPHHMLDVVTPDERFTLADYKLQSEAAAHDILKRGHVPILCGGTGLYIRSIVENFDLPMGEDLAFRRELQQELEEKGEEQLHARLQKLDPVSAQKIHPHNHRFLIRALEINHLHGPKPELKKPRVFRSMQLGVSRPREEINRRINKRATEQIEKNGLVDEVKKLLDMGYGPELHSMSSLGYLEIIQYLNGEISLQKALELIKIHTRQYAKRQQTWFRRDRDVHWVHAGQ